MSLTLHHAHPWDLTPGEAQRLQTSLRSYLRVESLDLTSIHSVAGLDAGFSGDRIRAASVLLSYPALDPLAQSVVTQVVTFPYIPGLLSFREMPAYLAALEALPALPDVLLVDGHGYAHPRRFGIACHLGVLLDLPVIGCAKSILVGTIAPLDNRVGSTADLVDKGEVIGIALRTRQDVKPVFLSIGQRVDLPSSISFALSCAGGYRLPEPCRLAHLLASEA